VLIRGKRIDAVGPTSTVSVPADSRVIDATGKTVVPGLADMHVHLVGGWDGENNDMLSYQRYLNALLYAGVTTVLDTGNVQPYILQMRQEVASGRLMGPRIYCGGALIDGPDPIWPELSISVSSASQIPSLVQRQKSLGVDVLKAYAGLSVPEVARLVAEGQKVGLRVFVDQGRRNGPTDLMKTGIAGFAHLPRAFILSDEGIDLARTTPVSFITTIATTEAFAGRRLQHTEFVNQPLIQDTSPPWFLEQLRAFASRNETSEMAARRAGWDHEFKTLETNAGKLWKAGGLASGEWGTLQPGRSADLLVINGNPEHDIRDTHNIEIVIKEGVALDRQKLMFNAARDSGFRTFAPLQK
jgi:hypothetical protein